MASCGQFSWHWDERPTSCRCLRPARCASNSAHLPNVAYRLTNQRPFSEKKATIGARPLRQQGFLACGPCWRGGLVGVAVRVSGVASDRLTHVTV